jgi:hypothetical protein
MPHPLYPLGAATSTPSFYGTYRAAILRNSHNLAEEMGNSVAVVRTYYDAVVSPSVAKLWWKIRPEKPENVVPMNAAT